MECPYCSYPKLDVINSRKNKQQQFVWRRRACPQCGLHFTTHETLFLDDNLFVKKKKVLQPYASAELLMSISRACDHLRSPSKAFWLHRTIETLLLKQVHIEKDKPVIEDTVMHTIILEVLTAFDRVSAVKYAAQEGLDSQL
jgi:transcriptional regulator NrdR family protein